MCMITNIIFRDFIYLFTVKSYAGVMCTGQSHATKLIRLYRDIFSWLPLATIIDNKVLVCHGGVSDKTDLNYLTGIDRHQARPATSFHRHRKCGGRIGT